MRLVKYSQFSYNCSPRNKSKGDKSVDSRSDLVVPLFPLHLPVNVAGKLFFHKDWKKCAGAPSFLNIFDIE